MHSESLSMHDAALSLFSEPGLEHNLDCENQHREIIEKFGRYPHRNKILARESTLDENNFLEQNGGF